jgi:predicted nucleic acid-binding Zn ribbon protein
MKFRTGRNRTGKVTGISGILPDIIRDLNIEDQFIMQMLRESWIKISGEIIAAHSIPDRIFKNMLFIAVDHPVFANELMMMKNAILMRIDETIGKGMVKSVKVEIKRLNWNMQKSQREN